MTTVSTTNTNSAATSTTTTPTINADFNMFLKLLTTQMQNQDPTNPMDTSQYTQQLVQYSQVEQSMQQTSTLKSMLAAMSTSDLTQASGLIGRQVSIDSGSGSLGDKPVEWSWSASRNIAGLSATITDANGKTVEKRSFDADATGTFSWDGTLSGGGTAPAGNYTISFSATDANGDSVPVSVTTTATVTQVAMEDGTVMLGSNGQSWPMSLVQKVAVN